MTYANKQTPLFRIHQLLRQSIVLMTEDNRLIFTNQFSTVPHTGHAMGVTELLDLVDAQVELKATNQIASMWKYIEAFIITPEMASRLLLLNDIVSAMWLRQPRSTGVCLSLLYKWVQDGPLTKTLAERRSSFIKMLSSWLSLPVVIELNKRSTTAYLIDGAIIPDEILTGTNKYKAAIRGILDVSRNEDLMPLYVSITGINKLPKKGKLNQALMLWLVESKQKEAV